MRGDRPGEDDDRNPAAGERTDRVREGNLHRSHAGSRVTKLGRQATRVAGAWRGCVLARLALMRLPVRWLPAAVGLVTFVVALGFMFAHAQPWTLRLDNRLVMFPLTLAAWRRWLQGEVPQWTDGIYAGFPLLAEPNSGGLYPVHWLAFGLTGPTHLRAFDVSSSFHVALFAAGMTALVRALGARPFAAGVAGTLAVVGPEFVTWVRPFMPSTSALGWWPWGLLAAERIAVGERAGRWLVLGSLAIGGGVLGGYPEFAIYGACADALWVLARSGHQPFGRRLGRLLVLAIAALLLAAPQMFPTMIEMRDSIRAGRPPMADVLAIGLWGLGPLIDPRGFVAGFVGVAAPLLAAVALVTPQGRRLAGIAALAFLVSLGPATPVYGWISSIPPFYWFRSPAKFAVLTEFLLTALAGLGLDRLLRVASARRVVRTLALALVLGVVVERLTVFVAREHFLATAPNREPSLGEVLAIVRDGIAPAIPRTPPGQPAPRLLVRGPTTVVGGLPMLEGIEQVGGSGVAIVSQRSLDAPAVPPGPAQLDLLGVDYVFQPGRACGRFGRLVPVHESAQGCVYRHDGPAARYAIVTHADAVPTEAAFEAAVSRATDGSRVPVLAPSDAISTEGRGTVTIRHHSEGHAVLDVVAEQASLVLVRESWKPGWHATVDGVAVPTHRAAGIYFVVPVAPGRHVVEVVFHQPGLRLGLAGGAVWMCAVVALLVRERRLVRRA